MKVHILVSIAAADWSYAPGQVVDLDGDLARAWVKSGIAEPAGREAPETTAMTPPEAAVMPAAKKRRG